MHQDVEALLALATGLADRAERSRPGIDRKSGTSAGSGSLSGTPAGGPP